MIAPAAVFLDRDGTIIEDQHYLGDPKDVHLIPGAAEAIAETNRRGVPVIIISNQSGIALGYFTEDDYERVRERFESLLGEKGAHIDATYYCPHHPDVAPCDCRKPSSKLFREAISDFELEDEELAFIGDRWRDVAASTELGGRAIMIESPETTAKDLESARRADIEIASSLQEAVNALFTLTELPRQK